jgi:hypothetical protein
MERGAMNRDPQGLFISRSSALTAWLPKLADWYSGDVIAEILEFAARQAGKELQARVDWQNDLQFDLWTRRWRFLRKALEDWKAIKYL